MPYNAASCDSSTYSFASGKLDYLLFRVAIDVDREDANDLVLNRIFRAWFREWTILEDLRDTPPNHQWDWPLHPVIDQVAHSQAIDMDIRNGTRTLRQVFSDAGQDFEDQITVMAEDYFGAANDDTINRMRQILLTTLYPAAAASSPVTGSSASADEADDADPAGVSDGAPSGDAKPTASSTKSAAASGDVQGTALNGAQITALVAIAERQSQATMPPDAARAMLQAAFPLMDRGLIDKIVDAIQRAGPKPKVTAGQASSAEPAEGEVNAEEAVHA
jgi:hypothetical protein